MLRADGLNIQNVFELRNTNCILNSMNIRNGVIFNDIYFSPSEKIEHLVVCNGRNLTRCVYGRFMGRGKIGIYRW